MSATLHYHGRAMAADPVGRTLAEVAALIREGRTVEVALEPGDSTRYDLALVPDIALPGCVGLAGDEAVEAVVAIRFIGGEPAGTAMLYSWAHHGVHPLANNNDWTAALLAWWFGRLFSELASQRTETGR